MKRSTYRSIVVALSVVFLSACGGGSGGSSAPAAPAPASHSVDISWAANREAAVNSPGGGYTVAISGQSSPIDVPYVSGASAAPTMVSTTLMTGSYSGTVTAYSALNPPGVTTGSKSLPSSTFSFSVP